MKRRWFLTAGTAAIACGCVAVLRAQYPGHIDTQKKAEPVATLRSIAVVEWTGDRSHPNATRLVPVSLFDGEHLQDGGLYLARPVPLALDSGTEYEVESSGRPQGWFDVDGARQLGEDWFGFGNWKPYVPPPPKKLHPSRNPPTVVRDRSETDDKPHFVRRDQSANSSGNGGSGSGGTTGSASQTPTASVDPDRPKLRRRSEEDKPQQTASASAPESPSTAPDADRPRLSHGKPADLKDEPKPLELTPVAMGQAVAVSDAESVGTQSFAFDWSSPADAANVQKELEAQAVQLLAGLTPSAAAKNAGGTAAKSTAAKSTAASHSAATASHKSAHAATGTAARRRKARPAEAAPPLTDVHFNAFELTYGGGATLVLTARDAANSRSIAVIALEDIYGKVQVLWHSVTDDTHLDVTPRMTLVDAVDPRGDGRANLLFEERNATDRRFVLYAVGAATAERVFATDPLPLHPVAQPSE